MEKEATKIFGIVLDNARSLYNEIQQQFYQQLDLDSKKLSIHPNEDIKIKEQIKASIGSFSYNVQELDFIINVQNIIKEEMKKAQTTGNYDLMQNSLIERLKGTSNIVFSLEDDFKTLSSKIANPFISQEDFYKYFMSKEEKIKNMIQTYNQNIINALINLKRNVTTVLTLGLAGLSIYDILKDGTVIPEISRKLFKDVPDNIYLMIPEKPMIDSIDYNGNIIDRKQGLEMIEDLDKAKTTYNELEAMQKETTFIGEKASDIQQAIISSGNDVANGSFLDGVKEFFDDPVGKLHDVLDSIVEFTKDVVEDITNPKETLSDAVEYVTETKYVPDTEKIAAKINSLSNHELVDLAYYYNLSPEIDMNVDAYQAIGNALQKKIGVIQTGIDEYNKAMEAIKITSSAAEATAVGSEVVGDVKKYIR